MEAELDWAFFEAQLPPNWKERAVEMGLIRLQPAQLHAKVTDIEQVVRPLMHRLTEPLGGSDGRPLAALARQLEELLAVQPAQ